MLWVFGHLGNIELHYMLTFRYFDLSHTVAQSPQNVVQSPQNVVQSSQTIDPSSQAVVDRRYQRYSASLMWDFAQLLTAVMPSPVERSPT